MSYLERNGRELFYEVLSERLPKQTLFIHGNMASSDWWLPSLKHLPEGSDRAVFMDWFGCGKSGAPKTLEDMSLSELSEDYLYLLRSTVRSSLPESNSGSGKKWNLVGHSTGGLIALLLMAAEPDMFERAVLLDPVGYRGVVFDPSLEEYFKKMAMDEEFAGAVVGGTIHNHDFHSSFHREVILRDAHSAAKKIGLFLLHNLKHIDRLEEVKRVKAEVLVLHGELDQVLAMKDSQDLSEKLPRGIFKEISNHGHCWNLEDPKAFSSCVSQFLFSGPN